MIAVVDTLEINCGYSIQLDDDINITQKFSSSKQTPSFSFLSQKFLFFILKGSFLANQQALLSEINQAYFSETIPITFEPVPIAEDLKMLGNQLHMIPSVLGVVGIDLSRVPSYTTAINSRRLYSFSGSLPTYDSVSVPGIRS
ncbi:hypothetical protein PHYBLDRAFT_148352 [Phycomyces blakesleeanus NRRL 1555(-)]|uniref:Uncharacterized protein n=1 Tax=Phycomyces blakesleeanus (strain ATCC 8743b / DSM 1359 / FGSC 10004 / NBRC 33097 / NRRL 1555) TaxID=763407 RepID=A0A162PMV3_PHYB8|nr:hypothetical protein PHYBLDRAFT_148352 [Phycomyces blakesleeanus NRRL 1555(-)]OAD70436.1 hypothetical protein PHYBLDRAFT_148352 [Phycomyces blakesleeanus NRRL 1555(-)]|eukprot:XP_018288476.1 hypothetical protein PHYBLDRAFT_148352 [Phycomyces blakesleeanus NRRL 1555(-)]